VGPKSFYRICDVNEIGMGNSKFWICVAVVYSVQDMVRAQIPLVGAGSLTGGIPYPNQVTDIGIACLQYEDFAKKVCKPTPTEFVLFRPKCDQWRLYCKGLKAPSATAPDPEGIVPPPPPDVCPQINYCTVQKGQHDRVCPRPIDTESIKFCNLYGVYCKDVPLDTDGTCASQTQQQQQFQQQQYQYMLAQQQAMAAQSGAGQSFNGNPFPFSTAGGMPGTYTNTGIIGK